MVSVVTGGLSLEDEPDKHIISVVDEWIPKFAEGTDRQAWRLVGKMEKIIEFSLYKKVGYKTLEEYCQDKIGHSTEWIKGLISVYRSDYNGNKTITIGELTKRDQVNARSDESKRLVNEEGLTQQQAAEQLGVSRRTVSDDVARNSIATDKPAKPKWFGYSITKYTTPQTAANKIRDKFGDRFADELKMLL